MAEEEAENGRTRCRGSVLRDPARDCLGIVSYFGLLGAEFGRRGWEGLLTCWLYKWASSKNGRQGLQPLRPPQARVLVANDTTNVEILRPLVCSNSRLRVLTPERLSFLGHAPFTCTRLFFFWQGYGVSAVVGEGSLFLLVWVFGLDLYLFCISSGSLLAGLPGFHVDGSHGLLVPGFVSPTRFSPTLRIALYVPRSRPSQERA